MERKASLKGLTESRSFVWVNARANQKRASDEFGDERYDIGEDELSRSISVGCESSGDWEYVWGDHDGGGDSAADAVAPPDLPSLLLNARICYIGMSLVPAVTELVVAELLYLGYEQAEKPAYLYIHSAGSMGKDKDGKGKWSGVDNEASARLSIRCDIFNRRFTRWR